MNLPGGASVCIAVREEGVLLHWRALWRFSRDDIHHPGVG